jgi:ferredoxin-NADP reductase
MFGLLRTTTLTFIEMRMEEGGVHSFAFHPMRPLHARAGQHGLLTLKGAGTKAFSLASAPADPEVLIGTRLQSGSPYKLALSALRPGHQVILRGPILNFTVDPTVHQAVFLAQGVGITPYRSLLRDLRATGSPTHTTLIHVGRGHSYRSETEPLAHSAHYPTDTEGFRSDLTAVLTSQPDAVYYISGTGGFIRDTTAMLHDRGIRSKHIKKDHFTGYRPAEPKAPISGRNFAAKPVPVSHQ